MAEARRVGFLVELRDLVAVRRPSRPGHDAGDRNQQQQRRDSELFAKGASHSKAAILCGQPRGDNSGSATPASANPRARSWQLSQRPHGRPSGPGS